MRCDAWYARVTVYYQLPAIVSRDTGQAETLCILGASICKAGSSRRKDIF